jgi:NAD(P)-dependent dehydrogenase (short-subunit alcohol dehydrogenase family)
VDLCDASAALAMLDAAEAELGPIDILVNSAGAARRTPFGELQPQAWHDAMQAKFFTYIHAIDAVLPGMAQRRAGAIVNIVGMGGKLASPVHLPGGSANAALMLASSGLANAYAAQGVRVNVVNPGMTATERMQEGLAAEARLAGRPVDEMLQQRLRATPMGRIAEPGDIADVVVFLASPRAGYVSGAVVSMDGAATPMVV